MINIVHTEEEQKKERTKCVPFQKIAHNQSSHNCKRKKENISVFHQNSPKRRKRGSSSDFDYDIGGFI